MSAPAHVFRDRSDTFFGVCEAIGQDLGFNANILRIALGLGVLFQPVAVVAVYALLGLTVVASRLMFPVHVGAAMAAVEVAPANDAEGALFKLAA